MVRCDGARGLRPSPRIFANPAVGRRTFFEGAVVAVVVVAVVGCGAGVGVGARGLGVARGFARPAPGGKAVVVKQFAAVGARAACAQSRGSLGTPPTGGQRVF